MKIYVNSIGEVDVDNEYVGPIDQNQSDLDLSGWPWNGWRLMTGRLGIPGHDDLTTSLFRFYAHQDTGKRSILRMELEFVSPVEYVEAWKEIYALREKIGSMGYRVKIETIDESRNWMTSRSLPDGELEYDEWFGKTVRHVSMGIELKPDDTRNQVAFIQTTIKGWLKKVVPGVTSLDFGDQTPLGFFTNHVL